MMGTSMTFVRLVKCAISPLEQGSPPACTGARWPGVVPWFHTGPGRPSASPAFPTCTSAAPNPRGRLFSLLAEGEEDWCRCDSGPTSAVGIGKCYHHRGTCPRLWEQKPRAGSWKRHTWTIRSCRGLGRSCASPDGGRLWARCDAAEQTGSLHPAV